MKYKIDNPLHNIYLKEYNEICNKNYDEYEGKKSLHHIIPRNKRPDLSDDENNKVWLPLMDHCKVHYLLWKYNREYALEFWFTYCYFHKYMDYSITDEEYEQLKRDVSYCRKIKKNKKD